MVPVLEAVPNVSEGRDAGVHRALVEAVEAEGVDLLDFTADADHHRCVLTFVGEPEAVERASLALAAVAVEAVDLRRHRGVHPRIGALDVLPFVPLMGLSMGDAVASARRVGEGLAGLGIPVLFYGEASTPPGRPLPGLRKGGFEALVGGFPPDRRPDRLPSPWPYPGAHPTAGVACVGARKVLLAWNVAVEGVSLAELRRIAAEVREAGGGYPGLRALALELPRRGALQLSMNLEDPEAVDPIRVYRDLESRVEALGGRLGATEVIGMMPDALVLPAAADRLRVPEADASRLLSAALARHLSARVTREAANVVEAVRAAGPGVPDGVARAVRRLQATLIRQP